MKYLRNIKSLKKVSSNDYKIIWISDYYDAPISGLLFFDKKRYWFDMINKKEQSDQLIRRYAIVKLSKKQLEIELKIHNDFQKYVGTHWDKKRLSKPPKRVYGKEHLFYDKYLAYIESRPYENNKVIAWFEL